MTNIKPRNKYHSRLKELNDNKKCGFCNINPEFIIKEYTHWIWVYNEFPYWKYNTMVISKTHKIKFSDVTSEELIELRDIFTNAEKAYIKSGIVPIDANFSMDIICKQRVLVSDYESRSHLHIHLCPREEEWFRDILDPEAHIINTDLLRSVL